MPLDLETSTVLFGKLVCDMDYPPVTAKKRYTQTGYAWVQLRATALPKAFPKASWSQAQGTDLAEFDEDCNI